MPLGDGTDGRVADVVSSIDGQHIVARQQQGNN